MFFSPVKPSEFDAPARFEFELVAAGIPAPDRRGVAEEVLDRRMTGREAQFTGTIKTMRHADRHIAIGEFLTQRVEQQG